MLCQHSSTTLTYNLYSDITVFEKVYKVNVSVDITNVEVMALRRRTLAT